LTAIALCAFDGPFFGFFRGDSILMNAHGSGGIV